MSLLRIAQVSDTHIPDKDKIIEYQSGTANPRAQFLEVLAAVAENPPDLLVLSGDLAATCGEPESYAWMEKQLEGFPAPYEVMNGNHDSATNMQGAFHIGPQDLRDGFLYFAREVHGRRLLFLDTSSYEISAAQLAWLREVSEGMDEVLLFMHHPPLLCGCQFMDNRYALRNIEEVWPVLRDIPAIRHIFCGHYHTERSLCVDSRHIHLTPSTQMQIDCLSPAFRVSHLRPGWRWIEWENRTLRTWVEYV